jgi:hypothetical protein
VSLQGIASRNFLSLPVFSKGGTFLSLGVDLPPEVSQVIKTTLELIDQRFNMLRTQLDQAYATIANNTNGIVNAVGFSGSTQAALNFSKVALPIAGGQTFTWTFGATEIDTNYGIIYGFNGPNALPTVVKYTNRTVLSFAAPTPTGLQADLMLFR